MTAGKEGIIMGPMVQRGAVREVQSLVQGAEPAGGSTWARSPRAGPLLFILRRPSPPRTVLRPGLARILPFTSVHPPILSFFPEQTFCAGLFARAQVYVWALDPDNTGLCVIGSWYSPDPVLRALFALAPYSSPVGALTAPCYRCGNWRRGPVVSLRPRS